jgi:hypothetical protein
MRFCEIEMSSMCYELLSRMNRRREAETKISISCPLFYDSEAYVEKSQDPYEPCRCEWLSDHVAALSCRRCTIYKLR